MTVGWSKVAARRRGGRRVGLVVGLLACNVYAEAPAATPADAAFVGSTGELPAEDRDVLVAVLREAGVKQAKVRSVERSPERQVKVMLELASSDMEHAKAMYCQAGDEVLARFDPNASREKNLAVMLEALVAILPKAREIGCLNHVRNDDVITVDVSLESVPEAQRTALIKAGEAAVAAKKVERFLAPPREPESFHFEFRRRAAAAAPNTVATPPTSSGAAK